MSIPLLVTIIFATALFSVFIFSFLVAAKSDGNEPDFLLKEKIYE